MTVNEKFLSYEEACDFINTLNFISINEFKKWRRSEKYDPSKGRIPSSPPLIYKKIFSWDQFLGEAFKKNKLIKESIKEWPYEEAKTVARSFGLTSCEQWSDHIKTLELPLGFPRKPERYYTAKSRQCWKGWEDFLGTKENALLLKTKAQIGVSQPAQIQFNENHAFNLPFNIFRENVRKMMFESEEQYKNWNKVNGMAIKGYPTYPEQFYMTRKQWTSWPDVLGKYDGVDILATEKCEYIEAKKFAQSLNFKSESEWRQFWIKNPQYRMDIPRYPDSHYKNYWESWTAFLGSNISYRLSEQLYTGAVLFVARTTSEVNNMFEISISTEGAHSMLNHVFLNKPDWTLLRCYKFTDEVINNQFKNTRNFVSYLIKKYKDGEHYSYEGIIINNIYALLYDLDYYFEKIDISDIKIKKFEHSRDVIGLKNQDQATDTLKIDSNNPINLL
ncbi:MAG: hypothetical protein KDH96_02905 [Candidatus Riesia sp.]|nr:hypothetical protein [Candidatus Riesia sp.]